MKRFIFCFFLVAIVRADYYLQDDDNIENCDDYDDYMREQYQVVDKTGQSIFQNFLQNTMRKFVKDWPKNKKSAAQQPETVENPKLESDFERRYRPHRSARPVIVDTDIGAFPDDATALAIVHGLVKRQQVDLLGVVGSTRYEGIVEAISTINTFFGRSNIPIGVTHDRNAYSDKQGNQSWTEYIRTRFPATLHKNKQAEEAVRLYRRLLSRAPDKSVTILTIGEFTNLANLIVSRRDKISRLDGYRLVKKKVTKVISMAGTYPMTPAKQPEWNIVTDKRAASIFARIWPTKVEFVGSELGSVITCGQKYQKSELSSTNPIAAAIWFSHKTYDTYHGCYDAVAALMLTQQRYLKKFYCRVPGIIKILPNGENVWKHDDNDNNKMYYIRQKLPNKVLMPILVKKIDSFLPDLLPEPATISTTIKSITTESVTNNSTTKTQTTTTIQNQETTKSYVTDDMSSSIPVSSEQPAVSSTDREMITDTSTDEKTTEETFINSKTTQEIFTEGKITEETLTNIITTEETSTATTITQETYTDGKMTEETFTNGEVTDKMLTTIS